MTARRWATLTLVFSLAIPWSAALTVLGLWVLLGEHTTGFLADPRIGRPIGVSAFFGGQLVFLVCVSDRMFPAAARRLTVSVELLMALVFVGGVMASGIGALTRA